MTHASDWWTRTALVLALTQLVQAGHAQPVESTRSPARSPVTAEAVDQKVAMIDKVLNRSPVAARVLKSQNEQARRHFANARELVSHAQMLVGTGHLRGADALLNEAIWEVSRAQQLVPDPGSQQASERVRYGQLEDSVIALQRTALIALPQVGKGQAASEDRLARANALVEQAVALARADRYIEANKLLDQALVALLRDASVRLAGHTIIYDHRFANRREEFDFELARFRSFERLVPLALLEFRPAAEALALVDRQVAQARELRERAEGQAGRDTLAAIRDLVEGTEALRRALNAAGLVVQQTMDSE